MNPPPCRFCLLCGRFGLAASTPVHVVAKRVGHASAKMTLDVYGHVLSGQDGDAVAKLEAYWAAGA